MADQTPSDIPTQVDLHGIKRLIPHRYPFLLIDRVTDIVAHKSATGIKLVSANEPHLQGHFPDRPIMPGVLIVEAMAQTSAVLVALSLGLQDKGALTYFMAIDKARFRRMVVPGDKLELAVETRRGGGKVWKFAGLATVNGEVAAEAEITALLDVTGERSG